MQDASHSAPLSIQQNEGFMQYVLRLTETVCQEYSEANPALGADILECGRQQ